MARLWSCGFELNSLAAGVEMDLVLSGAASLGAIVTTPVHGGTYSYRNKPTAAAMKASHTFDSSSNKTIFLRFYMYITTQVPNNTNFIVLRDTANTNLVLLLQGTGSGLKAIIANGTTQTGSNVPLSTGQWYRIEVKLFSSATVGTLDLLVDGVSKISKSSINTGGVAIQDLTIGTSSSSTSEYYIDDIAINDASGSFQNSYPGAGNIVHLHPGGAGDSTQWVPTSGTNWSNVDEVTPDDATTLVSDVVLNESDFYTVVASGLASNVTVNVVSVGVRFRNDIADATTQFKVQIEKTSGGTITQSSAITPNSTTWKTNATASPYSYPITLYQDPDSANWTQTTLDSMQIGVKSTLIGVNKNQVSTVWALVDYVPGVTSPDVSVTSLKKPSRALTGVGL